MSTFHPIPFADLIRRVFNEYRQQGRIFGLPKEKFFTGLPEVDLSVHYLGKQVSTPIGPAAGPHTQLAQNIVLAWLAGSRIIELKTIQVLDQLDLPRPCIDTETVGFNVEWSQELRLSDSLREYVKAWMLIEIIASSDLLGEGFSKACGATVFDLSVGYDLKGITSDAISGYIEELKQATRTIDALRSEIPQEFARFRNLPYDPQIIDSITLSTFHGCPAGQIGQIVSYLLQARQVNVIIKLNPTLLGQAEVAHILHDVLGYHEFGLRPDAFEHDLQFEPAIAVIRESTETAKQYRRSLGLKFTNTLVLHNHKGYFSDDVMYLSGTPLHVLALHLLKRFRDALGEVHAGIPTSFSAGIDAQNIAAVLSLNLVPVTVCTDWLKPPGYAKGVTYLHKIAESMQSVGASILSDYILRRFHPAEQNVAAAASRNLDTLLEQVLKDPRYRAEQNRKPPKKSSKTLALFDCANCGRCIAVCPNTANFEYPVTPAEIPYVNYQLTEEGVQEVAGGVFILKKAEQFANFADCCNACSVCAIHCAETGKPYQAKPKVFGTREAWESHCQADGFWITVVHDIATILGRIEGQEYTLQFDRQTKCVFFHDRILKGIFRYPTHALIKPTVLNPFEIGHLLDMRFYHVLFTLLQGVLDTTCCNYVNVRV